MLGCMHMPAHTKQSGGIDLLPWDDHRAGGSNSAFPPLQVSYQPNGRAGTAGREWAEKNPVEPVGFPSLLCLLKLSGFPNFSHSKHRLASIASTVSSQAFPDTGSSPQCLYLDPSLSLPPYPTSLPNFSVPPWCPFPTAVPVHHPQAFELPGAQVYCQRCNGPVSPMAAHTIWGFFRWRLMPTPPQPTPQPKCLGDTCERGQCTPYC